jgi:peptide/nickel transport system substrate-binding protein
MYAAPSASQTEPTKGGTLKIGLGEQPSTHNPYGGMSDRTTISQFLESLVELDKKTLATKPLLALDWKVPDDKTYVFTLRQGVKFHDGTDFDASAVKAAFDYMLDPKVASPRASNFDRVASVEVNDPHTVTFHLKEPFGVFLPTLAQQAYFVSPTALKNMAPADLEIKPPGTGPFKVLEWVKDDHITFERFDGYWDPKLPYLDRLEYRILPDGNVKVIAFKAGEIDFVDNLPATEVKGIQADPNYVFASTPSTGYRSIYLNTAAAPFNNVAARQALAWLVDRDELIKLGTLGIGTPAYGPLAPPQWAFDPSFKPYSVNIDKAKAALSEAGLGNGFDFALKVSNSPDEVRMMEIIQAQLARAGVKMSLVTGEYNAIRATVISGDYQAFFAGWLGGPDPDLNMFDSFHSKGWFNWVKYHNPDVDTLLSDARASSDVAKRTEMYRKAQSIVSQEAPMIFLRFPYWAIDGQAMAKRVHNFVPDPMQTMFFKEVWVDAS